MDPSQAGERGVRTVRLDAEPLRKVLDALDATGTSAADRRKSPRYAYRKKAVTIHLQQAGSMSSPIPFVAPTRNLSEGGLSFLHGGFVYPGTRCMVQLITTSGASDHVLGTVVSCRYLESMIHEVSIRFDRGIDPSAYCTAAMRKRVLLVENCAASARLTKFHLEALYIEVEVAETAGVAIERAMSTAPDFILIDIELPDMDGCEATRRLRQRGYSGLIIAMTALTQKEDTDRCLAAGCNNHIAKPVSKDKLLEIILSVHEEPQVGNSCNDATMINVVDSYLQELPAKVRAVEEALSKEDTKLIESITRTLKGEATSFGFGAISELAAKVESSLVDGAALADVQRDINALIRLCRQAQPSIKEHPPAIA